MVLHENTQPKTTSQTYTTKHYICTIMSSEAPRRLTFTILLTFANASHAVI